MGDRIEGNQKRKGSGQGPESSGMIGSEKRVGPHWFGPYIILLQIKILLIYNSLGSSPLQLKGPTLKI